MGEVIEGRYKVVGEKPRREPFINSWWGLLYLAAIIAVRGVFYWLKHRH